jgi:SAM-dependent methyltransferase
MKALMNQLKRAIHPRSIKNKLLHYALQGNNVECVCCKSKYITFLPAGIEKRANARCIKCGSLERHRTLWMFLNEQHDRFSKPIKLLHVAPEKIFYKYFDSIPNIEYCPVDLMPDKYEYGSKTIEMDVTALTYPDNYFDAVICNHVLEHIRQDAKAMSELYRVLKPGGWAILNTPVDMNSERTVEDINLYDPKKQLELFGQPDHVRVYGKDFITRLQHAGFTMDVIDHVSKFSHNEQFKYGLKSIEVIFYGSK